MSLILAAPGAVPAMSGGAILGTITVSGLALGSGTALVFGVRGSDFVKIQNKKQAAWWGIVTGTIWVAAGGVWADMANGVGGVAPSLFGNGSGLGDPGQGGIALFLTLLAFGPSWKKKVYPAVIGIAAAVAYGTAGGVWGIFVNVVRMGIAQIAKLG
ncbi:hypothetical protein AB0N14_17675 [Streptomyces sp. NPDC051104]|uniref:hypothetical protein n=1 Tax=Streptomyces sp. NPDC051104 TaxID=3155044 RepID=UPI00342CFC2F